MSSQRSGERWWDVAEHDPVHQAAADWFARLQDSEVSVEETLEWQGWMRADPRHAIAFSRLEEAWIAVGGVSPSRVEAAASRRSRASIRKLVPLAIAASLVALSIILSRTYLLDSGDTEWRTAVGENRVLTLADGSQVTLGGRSQMEVVFDERARHVELLRGEAYFNVAKDPSRPFTVKAGDARVVAVGTQFNVRRGNERVLVAVVEGRVTVERAPSFASLTWLRERAAPGGHESKREPLRLTAGEQTTVGEAGVVAAVQLRDPATAAAWRNGLLSFQGEPLRYVLEDVNRYAAKPIVIEGDEIGELRITGTVMSDKVGEWITSLERAFAVRAVEEPERIVLQRE